MRFPFGLRRVEGACTSYSGGAASVQTIAVGWPFACLAARETSLGPPCSLMRCSPVLLRSGNPSRRVGAHPAPSLRPPGICVGAGHVPETTSKDWFVNIIQSYDEPKALNLVLNKVLEMEQNVHV